MERIGTQFTGFAIKKVQILTPEELRNEPGRRSLGSATQ
jgi:hypothetical protein